jgi:dTDP-4-amino-4,6-dideoxygalactose transaminase
MADWKIPLSDLSYGVEEETAVARVLKSRWLTMGEEVASFEAEFAGYIGTKHAIAVANGTAALFLAFHALGIGSGDEIIQPAINFVASANMTVDRGATPLFADIADLDDPTIDPADAELLATPRSKAIVVMHYGGHLCRMSEIRELCRRRGLKLIEDACHGVGARDELSLESGKRAVMAGNLGDVACFSFFSNKNLAIGEGGMVTTNDDELARKVRGLRSHGMTTLTWDRHRGHASSYDVVSYGYNYRLDEIHAALGRAQLAKLDANNAKRKMLFAAYNNILGNLPGWTIPFAGCLTNNAYHLMVVVAPDAEQRLRVIEALKTARIQTSLHYPCVPDFGAFKAFRKEGLAKSRQFADRAITLPLYPDMSTSQVDEVCSVITKCVLQ